VTVTWRTLLDETQRAVGGQQVGRWIVEAASGCPGDELTSLLDVDVGERASARLDAMMERLAAGEPLQYVLGSWGFRHLDLAVDPRVLIPRPETELVVDAALELLQDRLADRADDPVTIVDLGTGSGAIGLALASELPLDGISVWLTDVSAEALALASANLAGIGRHARNVRIATLGSWFAPLDPRLLFDLIVSNPPYVRDLDPELAEAVRRYEPPVALYGGPDGLNHVRDIVSTAPRRLRPGGWLVMEIGAGQGERVRGALLAAGLTSVEVRPDLAGHDRIALARRASPPDRHLSPTHPEV